MKRFLQFVAVMVVAVLATQPALAGLTCTMVAASAPCAPRCPMVVDCPMAHHGASADCLQDCCRYPLPQAIARSSRHAKPKAGKTSLFLAAPAIPQSTQASFVAPPPGNLVAAAPARTILLQVFRI
ncbi:MAG TPA: hypothetical protein VMQ56_15550 [Terracidiphilus sp.]|jgi:hypothetical protein|nr:hypothetical protein [Terracidiphilus sp.]